TYFPTQQVATPTEEAPLATAVAQRGELVLSVDGVGNLLAANEMRLGFGTSGAVLTLAVQPGDVITKGQVLATLDDTDARYQVLQAGIGLRQAQLQLDELTAPAAASDIANARATLAAANASLQELTTGPDADDLAAAQNDLLSAQQTLNALLIGASADEQTVLQADLRSAEITLQQAQSAYNQIAWRGDVGATSQAADLQNATIAYERVKAQYNISAAGAEPQDISAARARVAQARAALNTLQADPNALTLLEQQARVEAAQDQLDTLLNGPDAKTLEGANLTLQQAQQSLDSAMLALAGAVMHAPVDGVVSAVDVQIGDQAGTAGIITVVPAGSSQVRFWIEELDSASVKVGNAVNIVFEAYPDFTFTGQVVRIEPTLVTVDGATAVQAWATVDTTQQSVNLLYGMNADVEVIAGEAHNAVLVPISALREIAAGSFAVFVVQPDGELTFRPVTVGLRDFVNAEIR
ncbi:MAG: HlyD family efflux transporter periplasmic adaptor subunit, partial [Caldilineaceae bacterium]|nr:HlyD family efflux transporter periplasmic adaptor subunit [Caldilineaceae bacterium]